MNSQMSYYFITDVQSWKPKIGQSTIKNTYKVYNNISVSHKNEDDKFEVLKTFYLLI